MGKVGCWACVSANQMWAWVENQLGMAAGLLLLGPCWPDLLSLAWALNWASNWVQNYMGLGPNKTIIKREIKIKQEIK